MSELGKFAFFVRWVMQKESSVDPRKFQHLAAVLVVVGLLVRNYELVYLGLGYFLVNHLLLYYVEFSRRKIYENYRASQHNKSEQGSPKPENTEKFK